jgi:hypothetical protein
MRPSRQPSSAFTNGGWSNDALPSEAAWRMLLAKGKDWMLQVAFMVVDDVHARSARLSASRRKRGFRSCH